MTVGGWQQEGAAPSHAPRPVRATTAAVLGFVAGGLAGSVVLVGLLLLAVGVPAGGFFPLMVVALPCAIGLIRGSVRLLRYRLVQTLTTAALGSVVGAFILALMFLGGGLMVVVLFLLLTLPLPVGTYLVAGHPDVLDWARDGND